MEEPLGQQNQKGAWIWSANLMERVILHEWEVHSSNWLSLYRSNTMLIEVDCNLELILDVLKIWGIQKWIDLVMVIWSPNMSWNPQPEILIYGSHRNKAIYHLALTGHSIRSSWWCARCVSVLCCSYILWLLTAYWSDMLENWKAEDQFSLHIIRQKMSIIIQPLTHWWNVLLQ